MDMAMMRYQEAAYISASSDSGFGAVGFQKEIQGRQTARDTGNMLAGEWAAGSVPAGGELDDHTDHMTSENLLVLEACQPGIRKQKQKTVRQVLMVNRLKRIKICRLTSGRRRMTIV